MITIFVITFTYAVLAFFYIVYRYYPIVRLRPKDYVLLKQKVSIIVPVYNEPPANLRRCLQSVVDVDGEKEIIVVDDCSPMEETAAVIRKYQARYPDLIKTFRQETNMGKRHAQVRAINEASSEIIVTVDSDTLVSKDAIWELIKPFSDPSVGASTGEVLIENNSTNFLTSLLQARYWAAFNFEREGLSRFGVVTCCSGPLSAYRKPFIWKHLDDYINENFLGEICTFGDDRHLTRMVLQDGHKVVYTQKAKAKTYVPDSLKDFLKQQLRWKKSFIRESSLIFPYALKRGGVLLLETFSGLAMPVMGAYVRIVLVILVIRYPFMLPYYLVMMIITATIRSLLMIERKDWKLWFRNIQYAFVHETMIFWLFFVALLTLNHNQWGTRGLKTRRKA
ncbi:hypothetical protein COT78_01525 [Candidatus Berkelbacteria bacterium CG10_big_fil_rev_8_21_14_0_10_43_13]|uniref:Glycosyltransferase 2-like domain-containing protein n=1 Tax=Candidatus Berkelbacteria bacterium CG10_big_fil_rev_8_21_14_0_10_43_13 TaxID=1974514 RepID=A0A2H0W7A5_9BACT|nr:MAG: hypothetical protein COT78_01525 [Candidatus Berkelbacteria bacterium CG10_big_fil_rev_8_21_14_0_10_43_13]